MNANVITVFNHMAAMGFYWQMLMMASFDSHIQDVRDGVNIYRDGFYDRACHAYHEVEPFLDDVERQILKQWIADGQATGECSRTSDVEVA